MCPRDSSPARRKSWRRFRKWSSRFSISKNPPSNRNSKQSTFDFIIGTNVLHAVRDVRAALRNLHGLLAPGGSLVFMDTATPQLWTETVFGLTSGWWRFTDRDLRPEQPLLKRAQWETVLRETGFSETASLPGLIGPTGGEGQIGLLARKALEEADRFESDARRRRKNHGWFSPTHPDSVMRWSARLRETARAAASLGRETILHLTATTRFTLRPERWKIGKSLFEACADPLPERIVYLWNLDARNDRRTDNLDALLHFTHALESARPAAKLRLDLVTRNAQPAAATCNPRPWRKRPASA